MELDRLQSEARRLTEGLEHPRVGAALALGEECGEILKWVLDREVYGSDESTEALAGEIGDALVTLAELCDRYDLSLGDCAAQVLAKLETKAPEWREQLGGGLSEARRRLDGDA